MHILMFGWEFPPANSGGLGVACQGIAEGLISHGHQIYMVLPRVTPQMVTGSDSIQLLAAHASGGVVTMAAIPSTLYSPYSSAQSYLEFLKKLSIENPNHLYGSNLMEEVARYSMQAAVYAKTVPHDVIHSHDWLTAEAGIQAKKISGKPHVMHVHATEIDRAGDHPNEQVFQMERRGMEHADRIIAVSEYTKKMIVKYYGISGDKIDVVHNAVKPNFSAYHRKHHLNKTDQIVLFLGRMTMQKGPDYFLKMARKVLEVTKKVKFVMAGDGDMMEQVIRMATELGIERHVLFSGFLVGKEVARAYSLADLYVMPSVSEPFGIAPLEAIKQGAPVLISKQSGVSEVIKNALRVDFWDVDEMANQVLAVLSYPALGNTLRTHGTREVEKLSWHQQAKHILKTYEKALS